MFCKVGTVLDERCEKVIGHVWCDIDAYSEGISCTSDGCYYYERKREEARDGK